MLRGLGQDLRFALRMLAKAPGTGLAVLLSLPARRATRIDPMLMLRSE